MAFRGIIIEQTVDQGRITEHSAELRDLPDDFLNDAGGESPVDINVQFSGVNYKDGLAVCGRPGVLRASPLIPGIDLVGEVTASADDRFEEGDTVVLTGGGIGEDTHGGLAERARVSGEHLITLPEGITARRAAAVGTAGITAMLSVLELERAGLRPDQGPVLVTGAAGGVGSVAVAILSRLGYQVTALTGRVESQGDYLRDLGAAEVLDRAEFAETGPALQKRLWAGAVDAVGSSTLANVLSQTKNEGVVTACGLAQGPDLPTTVMPFILRGVSLIGINSVTASRQLRERAWLRLTCDLSTELLDSMTEEISLDQVPATAEAILDGSVRGRTIVRIR